MKETGTGIICPLCSKMPVNFNSIISSKAGGHKTYRTELALHLLAIELYNKGIRAWDIDEELGGIE